MLKSVFGGCCNPNTVDYTVKLETMETETGKTDNSGQNVILKRGVNDRDSKHNLNNITTDKVKSSDNTGNKEDNKTVPLLNIKIDAL